jgi:hypothetical protein
LEYLDQSGGGVMSDPNRKDKVEEEKRDIKKTPEYRKFRKLLKVIIKAPPMRKRHEVQSSDADA